MKRPPLSIFSLSFFDVISCALGAVLLLVIVIMRAVVTESATRDGILVLQVQVQSPWTSDIVGWTQAYTEDDHFLINGERADAMGGNVIVTKAAEFPPSSASVSEKGLRQPEYRRARQVTLVHTKVVAPMRIDYVVPLNPGAQNSLKSMDLRQLAVPRYVPDGLWVSLAGSAVSPELRQEAAQYWQLVEPTAVLDPPAAPTRLIFTFTLQPLQDKKVTDVITWAAQGGSK
ncbi:MAG: hypothetical protein JNK25_01505 [Phycisphaerae bacterium]|nr:hypothetical protein [Phycisphaerae bacterium]